MGFYCRKCKGTTEANSVTEFKAKDGRRMLKGKCSVCGSTVTKVAPRWDVLAQPEAPRPEVPVAGPVVATPPPAEVAAVLTPVGRPVHLGGLTEGTRFEVGGKFYVVRTLRTGGAILVTKIPDGPDYTMGSNSMVRLVNG